MTREEIIAGNSIADFVRSGGHELRRAGQNFVTSGCPVTQHKRGHRPVMIYPETQSWSCHDCKRGGSVIDWLMIEKNINAADAMRILGGGNNSSSELVATYDYTDESGNLLYQTCRYQPKNFRQRRPDGKGGWIWNLDGVRRVLYCLPEVLKAQTVCVPEGEKDCDNLAKLGFVATTNPMGAGKWHDEYSETLRAKDVIVFGDVGDDDGAGERHTKRVIESLAKKAKAIKHVTLLDGFHDVSDYIASLPPDKAGDIIRKLIDETGELEPESLGESDGKQTDLTSLSSLGAAEFPAPPDEAAFYGLAGDIVRRIEPHTEADPVALLLQVLTVFGNIIGRDAYTVADGARHYLKLFTVLVGKTSKGRKGTAWRHVKNVFSHVDEEWCKNIGHGLSSGEGLIWAVRDPIEEKKPIKEKRRHTGEYQTVITDHGVSEKRLLVIEAEFANVLKVGTREGNTLSPVIRSAWDDDNLRTMTKNSPARATGAHISMIGHITREEFRRELTQTESANGFANRYWIVAVDRSKCLPEGGEAYGYSDLVEHLKNAIGFAKQCDELKRGDAARELWAQVYPKLSEGKPGLLGAITARAEAQVLRSSCIYALLDCSNVVRVEHLKAALALWDYSERSAAWVFETATGNKNADKIRAALRVAREKGLTKWEITANVFSRNVPKFEIEEALRLLHDLKLATCKPEKTGGRPAERWFYQARGYEENEGSPFADRKTGDTSFSSYDQPSQNASFGQSDKKAETLVGDELGVGRL
jgi:5S rRNA maturation endonuclease (ribonuclease M5)